MIKPYTAIDIGLFTNMLWAFEEREKLLSLIEGLCGTRFHSTVLLIGRLRYDIPLIFISGVFRVERCIVKPCY